MDAYKSRRNNCRRIILNRSLYIADSCFFIELILKKAYGFGIIKQNNIELGDMMKRNSLKDACDRCPKPTQWLKIYTYLYHGFCFFSFIASAIVYLCFTDLSDKATSNIIFASLAAQGICFVISLITFIKLLTVNKNAVRFVYAELAVTTILSALLNAYHMALSVELVDTFVLLRPSGETLAIVKYSAALILFYIAAWAVPNFIYFRKRKDIFDKPAPPSKPITTTPHASKLSTSLSDSFATQFGFRDFDAMCQNIVYPIDKARYSALMRMGENERLESFAHFVGFRSARDMLAYTSISENKNVNTFYNRLEQLKLSRQIMSEYKEKSDSM